MLPSWLRNGRPLNVPLPRGLTLNLPTIPTALLLLFFGYLLHSFLNHPSESQCAYPTLRNLPRTSSPLLIHPSLFQPPNTERPRRPDYLPAPVEPKKEGMVVPDSVHYVYGLKPLSEGRSEAEELPYFAYLAIRSAIIHLKPKVIYFHYEHLPTGPWWDLIRPHLTLIKTVVPTEVLGRKIEHFAHKADVLRLMAMKHSGGIYLDIDVFVIRPFDDLLYYPTTLGMEASPDSRRTPLEPEGLCNAVIISEPNAPFIDRWIASYESFDQNNWAGHSVVKPWELAREHPEELQVLSTRAFFWPMWHGEEIQYTHERNDYDWKGSKQYAYHAWESLAMQYLNKLSPKSIREVDTSFHRLVRPFIGPEDDAVYNEWVNRRHRG